MINHSAIKINISVYILTIILLMLPDISYSQDDTKKPETLKDTTVNYGSYSQKMNGIFIAPLLGIDWPVKKFHTISKSTITYGFKIEIASFKLYPLVLGLLYKYQNNAGNDDFMTAQYLNTFDTKITSYGISADILLNRYFHFDFTLPFVTFEAKYISVKRVIAPETNPLNYPASDNLFGITIAGGFTLSIFDIYGGYTFAKDYSSAGINTKIHFALIKF